MTGRSWIHRCRLVDPPSAFYRVTDWYQPFDPPPPAPPIRVAQHDDVPAGRWDDPSGVFRTLYCATAAEGAIGEKLGDFALNPRAAFRIETYFEDDPDDEFIDDQLIRALDREDVESFNWVLAQAPSVPGVRLLDINHWRTHRATFPAVAQLLMKFGLRAFDRRALLDERRQFTRRLAGIWRAAATTGSGLLISGLRFKSRLPPEWICWALWEPVPLDAAEAQLEPVSIDHPALRSAARKLGVQLSE
jgi:hypothetical protein